MFKELLITNGDSAAGLLKAAGVKAQIIPWRDCLHEGPVPKTDSKYDLSKIRAEYLSKSFNRSFNSISLEFQERDAILNRLSEFEVVSLWFEHDLYDQLQLIQVLDYLSRQETDEPIVFLVQADDYIGMQPTDTVLRFENLKSPVSNQQYNLAQRAWAAFREETPQSWAKILEDDTSSLPYLKSAISRILEEFPDPVRGLSRTEYQILRLIEDGAFTLADLFRLTSQQEQAMFMGDWSFWRIVENLASGATPLLEGLEESCFDPGWPEQKRENYFSIAPTLTPTGLQILKGEKDNAQVNKIDRWIGGTHLTNQNLWRWDREERRLVNPS